LAPWQTQVLVGWGVRRKIWLVRDEDWAHDRENKQRHRGKKILSRKMGRHNQIAKRSCSQAQHGTAERMSPTREQRKSQRLERFHGRETWLLRDLVRTPSKNSKREKQLIQGKQNGRRASQAVDSFLTEKMSSENQTCEDKNLYLRENQNRLDLREHHTQNAKIDFSILQQDHN
jgi:hypothetical protein